MTKITKLLQLLNENSVDYVVIGANAFAPYGWVRATIDLDLFVRPTQGNIQKVRDALRAFGYDIEDASEEDFLNFKILLRQYDLPLDIHPFVKGVKSFDEIWKNKMVSELGDIKVNFASLDDLIKMKEAAGRPKDLEDLKILKKLSEKQD
jgi:predicted nucleotidyltransferase